MLYLLALAAAGPGEVTLSLEEWRALQAPPSVPAAPVLTVSSRRALVGRVNKGLLEATLTSDVTTLSPMRHPVLPSSATVGEVLLDGRSAALSLDGVYRLALEPGEHTISMEVLSGRSTDRFERRVLLDLPPGGPTLIDLVLPEAPIDVSLSGGVITRLSEQGGTTRVVGWLNGNTTLDLAWERKATHQATDARLETDVNVLVELGGDLVRGRGTYRFEILAGETDRVDLDLPEGIQITAVTGTDVLQWHTAAGRLQVLLKRVAQDRVDLTVTFQYPALVDDPTPLLMPLPTGEIRGALGVVAPVALDVAIQDVQDATAIAPRDVPQKLVDLSEVPLRTALSFTRVPSAKAAFTRRGEVLTSASRIEDLQGISLLMEDGVEVGKLRLSVRNADRQVLAVDLPAGARLTHCFRDGTPLKPAADRSVPGRVLVPLTRSARAARKVYKVKAGDTLSAIASANYGDANQYKQILSANKLYEGDAIQVGQALVLPRLDDSDTQRFTLELGWERTAQPLGAFGGRTIGLPSLDLEVQHATWHVYVPEHIELLTVNSNLTQVSAVRSDPVTRLLGFVASSGVLGGDALAGGGSSYSNVLKSRRSYFEADQLQIRTEALSAWPLVGQRIRFRGDLLGTEAPVMSLRFVGAEIASALHNAAFLGAFLSALWLGLRPQSRGARAVAVLGVASGAVLGHYLLGTYGRVVGGAELALAVLCIASMWRHRRLPRFVEMLVVGGLLFFGLLFWLIKPTLFHIALVPALWFSLRRSS